MTSGSISVTSKSTKIQSSSSNVDHDSAGTYGRIHRDIADVSVGGTFSEMGKTTNHSTFLTKTRSGGNSETRQSWFETEYSEDTRVNMVPGDGYAFEYIGSGTGSKTWDDYGFQHTYSMMIEEGAGGGNVAWAHTTEYAHFTNGVADPANQGRHTESGGGNVFDYNYKLTERDQISGTNTTYDGNDHTTITRDRDVTTVTKGDNKDNNYSAKMIGHDNTDRVTWKPDEDIWEYSHLVYDSLHTRTRRTGGSGGEGTTWGPGPGSSRTEITPTHVDTWASNNSSTGRVWGIKYINYSSGSGSSNPRAGSASAWGDTAPHTSYFEAYGGKSTMGPPVPENPNWKFGQGNTGLPVLGTPNLPHTSNYVGSESGEFSGVGDVSPELLAASGSIQSSNSSDPVAESELARESFEEPVDNTNRRSTRAPDRTYAGWALDVGKAIGNEAWYYPGKVGKTWYGYFVTAPTKIVTGIWTIVSDLPGFASNLNALAEKLATNPGELLDAIWEEVKDKSQTNEGHEGQGALAFEIVTTLLSGGSVGGLKQGGKLATLLNKVKGLNVVAKVEEKLATVGKALEKVSDASKAPVRGLGRLFGHNEYKIVDAALASKVKQGLRDYYFKHADNPAIDYVDNLIVDGQKRTAVIDTVTGRIKLNRSLLDPKWNHLHDGYLMEELQHFHQLHNRGWLGRKLTEVEHDLIESEVVLRLLKSGLETFEPR